MCYISRALILINITNKMTRSEKRGGPYVGVHLRRGDFSVSRGSRVVTLKNAAVQIVQTCMKLNLNRVYLATDAKKDGRAF